MRRGRVVGIANEAADEEGKKARRVRHGSQEPKSLQRPGQRDGVQNAEFFFLLSLLLGRGREASGAGIGDRGPGCGLAARLVAANGYVDKSFPSLPTNSPGPRPPSLPFLVHDDGAAPREPNENPGPPPPRDHQHHHGYTSSCSSKHAFGPKPATAQLSHIEVALLGHGRRAARRGPRPPRRRQAAPPRSPARGDDDESGRARRRARHRLRLHRGRRGAAGHVRRGLALRRQRGRARRRLLPRRPPLRPRLLHRLCRPQQPPADGPRPLRLHLRRRPRLLPQRLMAASTSTAAAPPRIWPPTSPRPPPVSRLSPCAASPWPSPTPPRPCPPPSSSASAPPRPPRPAEPPRPRPRPRPPPRPTRPPPTRAPRALAPSLRAPALVAVGGRPSGRHAASPPGVLQPGRRPGR